MSCPICSAADAAPLLDLGESAVFCNVQWPTREEALAAARAPIRLAACGHCGHVFNEAFDPAIVEYAPGYENSQHSSTVFSGYAERLVERLVSTYRLTGRPIVDIGCGRGDLLKMLSDRASGPGYGFDPSYAGAEQASRERGLTIVREHFDVEQARRIEPALVCSRHVLEHVPAPVSFLRTMRDALAAAEDAVLYIEVPNGTHLFRTACVWDVLYEHYSYFSAHSLRLALEKAGLRVLELYEAFEGQFLCAEAVVERGAPALADERGAPPPAGSADRMGERIARWKAWAEQAARDGTSAAIWGTGTKGVMFLNLLGLAGDRPVVRALDQNPAKAGLYVPGTGQRIALPARETLADLDAVVLMNSIYAGEVRERLAAMGVDVELLFADA